jgi:hypothetical protein
MLFLLISPENRKDTVQPPRCSSPWQGIEANECNRQTRSKNHGDCFDVLRVRHDWLNNIYCGQHHKTCKEVHYTCLDTDAADHSNYNLINRDCNKTWCDVIRDCEIILVDKDWSRLTQLKGFFRDLSPSSLHDAEVLLIFLFSQT